MIIEGLQRLAEDDVKANDILFEAMTGVGARASERCVDDCVERQARRS